MSFIDKLNRFADNPVNMNVKRSKFNLSHGFKCTLISGKLIPILCDEILPGDTIKLNISSLVRSITPAVPVIDNAYLDLFAFWVPSRLCTVHEKDWQLIHGENDGGFWAPSIESTLINTGNTFKYAANFWTVQPQSLADYLGIPVGFWHQDMELSRLPFNAYWLIWNEWFRDQNTQAPIAWKSYSANQVALVTYPKDTSLADVNKFHDYFTSALPSPQKGASVLLPIAGSAPVVTSTTRHSLGSTVAPLTFKDASGTNYTYSHGLATDSSGEMTADTNIPTLTTYKLAPDNLLADLTNATAVSVNEMRQAFAIQKLFEKDARGGSRYREVLLTHFGVSIPDNTVQVPEYLGGKRIPLNQLQVLQTSENGTNPLGTTGAFSNTVDMSDICTKSFAEFGYLMVVACIRNNQSYSQGISKMFTRYRRFDNYYSVFANLGEQAIKETEIYANDSSDLAEVFGYQEAWAEYRFKPTRLAGYLSANNPNPLDPTLAWTYGNRFSAKPVLNSSFMVQDRGQIDNTLVINNSDYQFICDFFFNYTSWRGMPYYSIPGLIDHH